MILEEVNHEIIRSPIRVNYIGFGYCPFPDGLLSPSYLVMQFYSSPKTLYFGLYETAGFDRANFHFYLGSRYHINSTVLAVVAHTRLIKVADRQQFRRFQDIVQKAAPNFTFHWADNTEGHFE